jgi:D-alanine-D-alanine ligase
VIEIGRGRFTMPGVIELHFAKARRGWGFKSEARNVGGERRRVYRISTRVASLPPRRITELAEISRTACRALELRGYAKLDLRMDAEGHLTLLEANANPGLWSGSNIWRQPSFETNLDRIIAAAIRRARE